MFFQIRQCSSSYQDQFFSVKYCHFPRPSRWHAIHVISVGAVYKEKRSTPHGPEGGWVIKVSWGSEIEVEVESRTWGSWRCRCEVWAWMGWEGLVWNENWGGFILRGLEAIFRTGFIFPFLEAWGLHTNLKALDRVSPTWKGLLVNMTSQDFCHASGRSY